MEDSILTSTKKNLGITEDYTIFDDTIISHINSVFLTLTQLGIGPVNGFSIEDETEVWDDFITDEDLQYKAVQSYMFLRVKRLFDPPTTSFAIESMDRQIQEFEIRLNIHREEEGWVAPV